MGERGRPPLIGLEVLCRERSGSECEELTHRAWPCSLAWGVHLDVVFSLSCGATTGFSTQVSVLSTQDAPPDSGGNAFIADADHGKAPLRSHGVPRVRVAGRTTGAS